ncbi:hypothetical protein RFI_17854, partial [Reticulomyxa filosa]
KKKKKKKKKKRKINKYKFTKKYRNNHLTWTDVKLPTNIPQTHLLQQIDNPYQCVFIFYHKYVPDTAKFALNLPHQLKKKVIATFKAFQQNMRTVCKQLHAQDNSAQAHANHDPLTPSTPATWKQKLFSSRHFSAYSSNLQNLVHVNSSSSSSHHANLLDHSANQPSRSASISASTPATALAPAPSSAVTNATSGSSTSSTLSDFSVRGDQSSLRKIHSPFFFADLLSELITLFDEIAEEAFGLIKDAFRRFTGRKVMCFCLFVGLKRKDDPIIATAVNLTKRNNFFFIFSHFWCIHTNIPHVIKACKVKSVIEKLNK